MSVCQENDNLKSKLKEWWRLVMVEDSYILVSLYRITADLTRGTTKLSLPSGLTFGQFAVLEALYSKGDLTVGQVKTAILSSDGTIPLILRKLEENGYITRTKNPDDGRSTINHLTEKGRALIAVVAEQNKNMVRGSFDIWSREEKKLLVSLFKKYHDKKKGKKL